MNGPDLRIPRPPLLSAERRLTVSVVAGGLWLTGAAWLLLHYFLMQEGPFGAMPHPAEFWILAAHGAFGFASLYVFGLLWNAHIPAGWRSLRKRRSGGLMFVLLGFLVLSGYLLYYVGDETLSPVLRFAHWGLGLMAPIPFLIHRFTGDKRNPSA